MLVKGLRQQQHLFLQRKKVCVMQKKEIFVGIDVSKSWLDAVIRGTKNHIRFPNNTEGFKQLQAWLKSLCIDINNCWFILEYTGGYEYRFVQFCQSKGLCFTRVPGLEIKKSLGMQRGKSDQIDAGRIAEYGYEKKDRLQPQQACNAAIEDLKELLTQRKAFVTERKANEHRLGELIAAKDHKKSDAVIKLYQQVIDFMVKVIEKTEKEIRAIFTQHEDLKRNFILITTVIGIGDVNGWMTIAFTENFERFRDGRKYGAYCGVVPYEHTSGKSIKGKSRVSPMANKDVKAELEMAARTAIRHDPEIKAYYARRKAMGKHHMGIMNEVRFKLILRMFAVVNKGEDYVKKPEKAA
jgi:transposase